MWDHGLYLTFGNIGGDCWDHHQDVHPQWGAWGIIIITKNQWFDRKPFVLDFTAPGLPNPTRCLIDPNDIIIWIPIFINPLLLPLSLSNHLTCYDLRSQHYLTATACVDFPRETFLEGSRCRRRKINKLSASRSSLGSCYVARPIVHFVTAWLQTRHHRLSNVQPRWSFKTFLF